MLKRPNRLEGVWRAEDSMLCTVVVDFPSDVWAGVARCLSSKLFACLRQCTRSVFTENDEKLLWRHFCELEGFVQQLCVFQDLPRCTLSNGQQVPDPGLQLPLPQVVWSQCFRQNKLAQAGGYAFACIRVRDLDIRVPIGIHDGDDSDLSATQAWLYRHSWRSNAVLGKAMLRILEPRDVPMRFRELISDRPGMLLRRACVYTQPSAASAIVEWPIGQSVSGDLVWSLPPFTVEEALALEHWEDAPAVRSGPHPYGRGYGWLVELNLQDTDRERMGISARKAPVPRWVQVGGMRSANRLTVLDLCAALKLHLAAMGFDRSLTVMPSSQRAWVAEEEVTPEHLLLLDLRWTQGERLHLKEAEVPRRLCRRWRKELPDPGDGECFEKVVLYQRETARPSKQRQDARPRLAATLSALGWTPAPPRQVSSTSAGSGNPFSSFFPHIQSSQWQRSVSEVSDFSSEVTETSENPLLRSGGAQPSGIATTCRATSAASASAPSVGRRSAPSEDDKPEWWSRSLIEASGCCGAPECEDDLEHSELEVAQLTAAEDRQQAQQGSTPERWYRQATPPPDHGDPLQELLNAPDSFQELPHERRLVVSSSGARQFEFHPSRPDILLAGRKDGVISIINHEEDRVTHTLELDNYPILGLSWLHTNPQWAVCGVSQAGTVCLVNYHEDRPGTMEHVRLESFSHLSSLSVNCTDEFFMTSGFCVDLGLYDLHTGRKVTTFRGVHQNFINIGRFSHRSPHIFATASFDHTCKLWDLREPVVSTKPVRLFKTESLNVMCCFSPDDKHILCSGVDDVLQQFNLAKDTSCHGSRFRLPSMNSLTNYRRSLYLTNGDLVATAGTNESQVRICLAAYPHRHLGHIDFKGALRDRRQSFQEAPGATNQRAAGTQSGTGTLLQRSLLSIRNQLNPVAGAASLSQPTHSAQEAGRQRQEYEARHGQQENAPRVRPRPASSEEYVQSLRNQPTDPMGLAALLSTSDANPESFITMLKLGKGKK